MQGTESPVWNINGPIYYHGQYHLFWQAFPFGRLWNTAFMYWGHATSKDLLHWDELAPALMLDSLGSPWSGTAIIDKNNDGGWGENTLVLFYTAFDRISNKQVQCIAYSTDNGKTFKRFKGNPIIDSNWEMGTTQTRDPKVLWYETTKKWVMVLFEKDGMSFYNSSNLKDWKKQSRFPGLHECPDFFELPVDGNDSKRKWVLHGGSSEYFIGSFNGRTFTPESSKLNYAEGIAEGGITAGWGSTLYAAQSFTNMPDNRRVQIAWGRIDHEGMPFTQMMLFPTEFVLRNTPHGIRLLAAPIKEIHELYKTNYEWNSISIKQACQELQKIKAGPLSLQLTFTLPQGNRFNLRYQGNELINLLSTDLSLGENQMEILIDKTVAEIFINHGERYIIKNLEVKRNEQGLELDSENYGPVLHTLQVHEMKSIWNIEH